MSALPLAGLIMLDLSRLLPGPFGSWLLRSWGARVIKVEEPGSGDYLRDVEPAWFAHLNAGAESVALDLKRPEGRELFLRLCARADAVLEGFRPGVLERLGLGHGALQEANPRLVLVSLTGYPQGGPLARRAGHDLNYLARSGLLSLMDEVPPLQLADLSGGLMAAAALLAALLGASRSGTGSHVEVSLFDAVRALGSLQLAEARQGRPPRREEAALMGFFPPYGLYRTADGGRVSLGALEPKFWRAFCVAVGRPDLESRHLDPAVRADLEDLFLSRPLVHWAGLAGAGDLCLEPVLGLAEAAADGAPLQPARFDGHCPDISDPPPGRGEQTRRILLELGLSEQEIESAAAEAIISV